MAGRVPDAQGLRLRRTLTEEIPFVRAAEAAPEAGGFVGTWSEGEHAACIDDGDCGHWVIEDGEGEPIGFVVLQGLQNPHLSLLLRRLVIVRKGAGAGRRTVAAVCRYCFEEIGFHRLWLDVREDNAPARRLYQRAGFVVEGRERECLRLEGRWLDMLRMSMLDREYRSRIRAAATRD
jgi:RimJ/RimL family protein N-acetyltransferase